MLTRKTALRVAEIAAGWLAEREPRTWLGKAIVVTSDTFKHFVCPRQQAIDVLEKARALAVGKGLSDLCRDIERGVDLVKATAPVDVPVVIFIERIGGETEMGVITLSLPLKQKP